MMDFISILVIAIALSMDSFCASISTGACMKKQSVLLYLKVAGFMAVFQGGMPLIGWLVGFSFKAYIEEFDHWIAFILLSIIGLRMIYEGIKNGNGESCFCPSRTRVLMSLALATSIDALIVGVGFGVIEIPLLKSVLIIAITTFVFSLAGVLIGHRLGSKLKVKLEIYAGIVLILLGAKILFDHLGYFERLF